jgi:hypothetical protein
MCIIFFLAYFVFGGTGVWTHGFSLAMQATAWATPLALFCSGYFGVSLAFLAMLPTFTTVTDTHHCAQLLVEKGLINFLPRVVILLILASQAAMIIGMCHQYLVSAYFLIEFMVISSSCDSFTFSKLLCVLLYTWVFFVRKSHKNSWKWIKKDHAHFLFIFHDLLYLFTMNIIT